MPALAPTEASSTESTDDDEPEIVDDTEELRMCPVNPSRLVY